MDASSFFSSANDRDAHSESAFDEHFSGEGNAYEEQQMFWTGENNMEVAPDQKYLDGEAEYQQQAVFDQYYQEGMFDSPHFNSCQQAKARTSSPLQVHNFLWLRLLTILLNQQVSTTTSNRRRP